MVSFGFEVVEDLVVDGRGFVVVCACCFEGVDVFFGGVCVGSVGLVGEDRVPAEW